MGKKEIDRRTFLARSDVSSNLAVSKVSSSRKAHAADNGKKPNILMIISDDLGGGDMGCYGNPAMRTENLDRLAGEGMRFSNAFCTASSCSSSRTSSGRLSWKVNHYFRS